ncbi:MAG: formyltransferase family protein [Rickettsiales bacterium]|nr:formyltransferase family protein [Rickettsiales bacterium]
MKILLLLNQDIYCAKALKNLDLNFKKNEVKIFLSNQIGKTKNLSPQLLEMKKREYCDIKKNFSFDYLEGKNINDESLIKQLNDWGVDMIISIRFGQILKMPIIKIPPFGVLNLHSGILPNYRGILASFWAILHGEKNLGATLHYINDSGIDTGEIISFSKSEIDWNADLIANINNIYNNGCGLISQVLEKISNHEEIATIDQKFLDGGKYFSYPNAAEIKKFLKIMPLFAAN